MRETQKPLHKTILSVIFTITLCMHGNYTKAIEMEGINPDMSFEFAIVLQGQSTDSISTTVVKTFDLFNVGILSIENQTLTASFNMTSDQTGIWWVLLIGIGKTTDYDFVYGLAPVSDITAQITMDSDVGVGLATGGVISFDPVSEEEPLAYNININGG